MSYAGLSIRVYFQMCPTSPHSEISTHALTLLQSCKASGCFRDQAFESGHCTLLLPEGLKQGEERQKCFRPFLICILLEAVHRMSNPWALKYIIPPRQRWVGKGPSAHTTHNIDLKIHSKQSEAWLTNCLCFASMPHIAATLDFF